MVTVEHLSRSRSNEVERVVRLSQHLGRPVSMEDGLTLREWGSLMGKSPEATALFAFRLDRRKWFAAFAEVLLKIEPNDPLVVRAASAFRAYDTQAIFRLSQTLPDPQDTTINGIAFACTLANAPDESYAEIALEELAETNSDAPSLFLDAWPA